MGMFSEIKKIKTKDIDSIILNGIAKKKKYIKFFIELINFMKNVTIKGQLFAYLRMKILFLEGLLLYLGQIIQNIFILMIVLYSHW